jgi:putative ABC transport system permease protein
MNALWQDIRFEIRVLLKSPLTVGIAALTLSLGIGANTAVFSLIKALIIRPLPAVRAAEDLVTIASRTHTGELITLSYPNYRDLRNMNTVFTSLEASAIAPLSFSENGGPARRQWGELVSGNYFETLGVKTSLGRPFCRAMTPRPARHGRRHQPFVLARRLPCGSEHRRTQVF